MNGWLNLYKPKGISSAKAVHLVKNHFKDCKIGHTGTLDLEAEGVLPIAIGQATKLVEILMNSKKQYFFTVQFGANTTTADSSGEIIQTTSYIPTARDCKQICDKFIGEIEQTPPAYSALKVNGVRAYKLARENKKFSLKKRLITIYDLKLLNYDDHNKTATYLADCSKGTYIRTLAEDISLALQSLGFVIELRRTMVGIFNEKNSLNAKSLLEVGKPEEINELLRSKCLRLEAVLDDIPVLEVDDSIAKKVRYGQECILDHDQNHAQLWLKHDDRILAIGSLFNRSFASSRVFNYIKHGE